MKLLCTIPSLHPEYGGPARSVPALCEHLAHAGAEVELVTFDYGATARAPLLPNRERVQTTLVAAEGLLAQRLHWTPRFGAVVRERGHASGAQLLHDHGLWRPTNHAAARAAAALNLPLVISPRGMLTAWALQHKGWKKRLALALYQRRDLNQAQVLHATAVAEAEDLRAAGCRQPIAVIPNGIQLPPNEKPETRNQKPETRTVLFLSRIHPKKGLMNLVQAWGRVRPVGWRVVIAGGAEGSHLQELKVEMGKLKLAGCFEFVGEVDGAAKWNLYQSADVFVLPSYSENFGIVIAEALACGVPVITTRGTPWEDLLTHRCGWWVDVGGEPLAAALREAIALDDATRRQMGARGRELVEHKFGWPGIAAQMLAVYRWMLGQGQKPDCVRLD